MKHDSRDIGARSQTGIPHDIEIGETRQARSIAEAASAGALHIEQDLGGFGGGLTDLKARVQCQHA